MTYVSQSKENAVSQQTKSVPLVIEAESAFEDGRAESAALQRFQTLVAESPCNMQLKSAQAMMANSSQVRQQKSLQAMMASSTLANAQKRSVQTAAVKPIQKMEGEKTLQGEFEYEPAQLEAASEVLRPNETGLPDHLKAGIENLSGMSMDHVKVHYNSDKPAQLQAHAYAQGRVKPTMQMKGDVQINDDMGLEAEADLMGAKANYPVQNASVIGRLHKINPQTRGNSVQRKITHPTGWFPAPDKPSVVEYNAVAGLNSVTLDLLTKTSKPEEIEDMGDPEIHKTILDPSRGNKQRLTKMHLVRGRFGAPGELENLMLGTALSNNFDDDSHYAQVEKPIADFLNEDKGRRMVDYKVTPYGVPPAYFNARLHKHPTASAFVKGMCPQIFACAVQFAATPDNVNWFWSPQQIEHVRLDNKYENGGDVVP